MGKIINVFKVIPSDPTEENVRNAIKKKIEEEANANSVEFVGADEKLLYTFSGHDVWGLEVWCKAEDNEEGAKALERFEETLSNLEEIQSCEKIGETLGR